MHFLAVHGPIWLYGSSRSLRLGAPALRATDSGFQKDMNSTLCVIEGVGMLHIRILFSSKAVVKGVMSMSDLSRTRASCVCVKTKRWSLIGFGLQAVSRHEHNKTEPHDSTMQARVSHSST